MKIESIQKSSINNKRIWIVKIPLPTHAEGDEQRKNISFRFKTKKAARTFKDIFNTAQPTVYIITEPPF